ncbi:glycosyltransferase family 2 protein [Ensifer soli]|uniref:glycosyltransferase family 2 protein n=1 Tax=Ciceribacter sp. sgz301302 TaxID=3342379 RepID=UPI0035BAE786
MTKISGPHTQFDMEGHADGVIGGVLTGWALNRADRDDSLSLELLCDGTSVATFRADLPRAVDESGIERPHGFEIALPAAVLDGREHELSIVAIGNGEEVVRVTFQEQIEAADAEAAAVAADLGPALSDEDGVTEESQAEFEQGLPVDDTEEEEPAITPATDPTGSTPAEVLVSTADTVPVTVEHAHPIMGQMDIVQDRQVLGWAFDPLTPFDPAELHVLVDGVPRLLIVADKSRPDVALAGIGTGSNGFSDPLPDLCFNGDEHAVEIVSVRTGQVILGGSFKVKIALEGVAFLDRNAAAIRGWARNCSSVRVDFDDGRSFEVETGLPVPGFAPTDKLGFRLPIPADMLDGRWHTAVVRFGSVDRLLDGNPIAFRLTSPGTSVELLTVSGRRITALATDPRDPSREISVVVDINGTTFARLTADQKRAAALPEGETRKGGLFSFVLPPAAESLTIRDAESGEILASWTLEDEFAPSSARTDLRNELTAAALADPALSRAVSERFSAFAAEPGEDFDASWYLTAYPDAAKEVAAGGHADALAHFVAVGSRAGHSPSPFFDEAFVRRTLPLVNDAVEAGTLASAFAFYLHLGKGAALDPLEGFDAAAYLSEHPEAEGRNPLLHAQGSAFEEAVTDRAEDTQVLPPPAILPPPLRQRGAADHIYAAWMERLSMPANVVGGLIEQEAAVRRFIGNTVLTRAPLVSIIMPTYNRAYTIGEAIQSALDQTYQNWELIIADDASDDKTPMVVAQFKDPRIRYMQFEKSNGAGTRNKGLRFARGEYIAYLDSDNLWDPLFLDVMMRHLLDRPGQPMAYAGYFDTEIVGARVTLQNISLPPFNPIQLSSRNFIDLNTIVHHRHLYEWIGGFDETLIRLQDWDLALQFTSVFNPIFVPFCLVYYRRNVAWGQVTHLFLDQNVKSTVADKTDLRLNQGHVKLRIDWPDRPRITLLADGAGNIATAVSFAELAREVADGVIVCPDDVAVDPAWEPLLLRVPRARFERPWLMTSLLANLPVAVATIGFGIAAFSMERLVAGSAIPAFTARLKPEGIALESVADARLSFFIGALPVTAMTEPLSGGAETAFGATVFPFTNTQADMAQLARLTAGKPYRLYVAPADPFGGRWATIQDGMAEWSSVAPRDALNAARTGSQFVIAARPLHELSLAAYCLVIDKLAGGTTALLRPEGFGRQLVEAGAAYRIDVATYEWILDKLPKLRNAAANVATFRERSAKCYRIQMHPELAQERIAFFIHQAAYGNMKLEVSHVA